MITIFFFFVIEQKQWREKKRIKTHVSMKEMVVSKVVKKWLYTYHFSSFFYHFFWSSSL